MANTIRLEVVTPNGLAVRTETDQVEAPSVFGEFGVLPGHLPLLAAVKAGVVRYRTAGKVLLLAVEGGFAEAGPDRVTVMTQRAVTADEIDVAAVRTERDDVQAKLDGLKGEAGHEVAELERERDWLNAQLDAAREAGKTG
jgi:F-type H+-transporting ATPase subunit epsilon